MLCAIWYHLQNLKIMKNTHGRVLLSVKLEASAYNYIKSNTRAYFRKIKRPGIRRFVKKSPFFKKKTFSWFAGDSTSTYPSG